MSVNQSSEREGGGERWSGEIFRRWAQKMAGGYLGGALGHLGGERKSSELETQANMVSKQMEWCPLRWRCDEFEDMEAEIFSVVWL